MKYFVYYGCFDSHFLREFDTLEEAKDEEKEHSDEHTSQYGTIRIIYGEEIEE